jgi:hypothetical protein
MSDSTTITGTTSTNDLDSLADLVGPPTRLGRHLPSYLKGTKTEVTGQSMDDLAKHIRQMTTKRSDPYVS